MDMFAFAMMYLGSTAGLIFILLFGENPMFLGTPVAGLHWLFTQAPFSATEWVVKRMCGSAGQKAIDGAFSYCCDRPNPMLQISYLALISIGYFLYQDNVFRLLPNAWVPECHIYTGTAAVLLCLASFLWASLADPGTITAANVAAHTALFPCDDLIFPEKECRTCKFERPARSKHCSVCNRCVSRFDHHCGWINNCVGLSNLRAFLTFLATNCAMCLYGFLLAGATLGGELHRRGFFNMKMVNYRTGHVMHVYKSPGRVVEFMLVYYPLPLALSLFMLLACLLLASFLGYQIYLLTRGCTQYEAFKWLDVNLAMIRLERERRGLPVRRGLIRLISWIWDRNPPVVMPPNPYDLGFRKNLRQVMHPHDVLATAAAEVERSTSEVGGTRTAVVVAGTATQEAALGVQAASGLLREKLKGGIAETLSCGGPDAVQRQQAEGRLQQSMDSTDGVDGSAAIKQRKSGRKAKS